MLPLEAIKTGVDAELLVWELLPSQSLFSQGTSVPVPSERGPPEALLTLQKSPSFPGAPTRLSCCV